MNSLMGAGGGAYQSPYDERGVNAWHQRSLVRSKSAIAFDLPLMPEHQLYSSAQTAYAMHELVLQLGSGRCQQLQGNRLADYLSKTEDVELHIVNRAVAEILDRLDPPEQMRIDLARIYTDEGYHVVLLSEFRQALRDHTGIDLVRRPSSDLNSIFALLNGFSGTEQALAYIACAIVTETLITSTLRQARDPHLYPPVSQMLADHSADENMHHAFFSRFAEWFLPTLSPSHRQLIEELVPQCMVLFLAPGLERIEDDLAELGLDAHQITRVMSESMGAQAWEQNMRTASIPARALFEKLGYQVDQAFRRISAFPAARYAA